jgi:hypothetical protein
MSSEREERKVLVEGREEERLRRLLRGLLRADPHGENGRYEVRSLYFDDAEDSSVFVKQAGLLRSHKWRLRIYGRSDRRIRLERKSRRGRWVHKEATSVDRATAERLCSTDRLDLAEDPLLRVFLAERAARRLRPVVVVDYVREAWLHPGQSLRVTLDQHLSRHVLYRRVHRDWLDPELPLQPVLGQTILEVKSTGGLPVWVSQLLPVRALSEALSKYVLCRSVP